MSVGETSVSLVKVNGGAVLAAVTFVVEPKFPVGTLLHPVQISFGKQDNVPSSWNVLTQALGTIVGSSLPNLNDREGNKTGVSMKLLERFNGLNENGPAQTETDLNMPAGVSQNSLFGNNGNEFGGMVIRQSVMKFDGLNPEFEYDFCFFASRMGVGDNRETKFILKGSNEVYATLNASGNSTQIACVNKVKPDAEGAITLNVTSGENNNNGNGFYYISALRMTQVE